MVDANKKDKAPKSELSPDNMEEEEEEDEYDDDDDDEFDEDEYEGEEEDGEEEEDDEEEEKVIDGGNAVAVVNNGDTETKKENGVKEDEKKAEKPKSDKKLGENSKSNEKRSRNRDKKEKEQNDSGKAVNGDNPESSKRKKASRVETMGMVFMCSSKTKTDCFRYKILGLPESKKDQVLKIYKGMRLFLFDVDLRLMYGIFKAAAPGGYNIEPKAFKSEFPSQVRFTVLDDCLPLAEEKFKSILKENYYSRNKFEVLLKPEQVKKLCRLFLETVRGGGRSKSAAKRRRTRNIEARRTRRDESRRSRIDDRRRSRSREERRRRARDEERRLRPRSRSPPPRGRRRYPDYDRSPVLYDREAPDPRYHLPQPTALGSPVRLYTYERQPLDVPSYVRDHVPEPHPYRVIDQVRDHIPEPLPYRDQDRDRDRDPYLAYGREPPVYRDAVYTVPPEYHLVRREYPHPSAVQPSEYHIPAGSRVPSYRDVEIPSDYRSSALALPEYRSRTHYKY